MFIRMKRAKIKKVVGDIIKARGAKFCTPSARAFTLIELSVVIVIIGLIVAGIVAGQSLVKQAQLRSVIAEINQINAALNAFKLQYDAKPGDFETAASYWPGCGAGTSAADCNGDGDEEIENTNFPDNNEGLRAWQHLNLAGVFNNSLSGNGAALNGGVNTYSSSYPSAYFYFRTDFCGGCGSGIDLGSLLFLDNNGSVIFSPEETSSVDSKIDDGQPTTGLLWGYNFSASNACAIGTYPTYTYNLGSTEKCKIVYRLFGNAKLQ